MKLFVLLSIAVAILFSGNANAERMSRVVNGHSPSRHSYHSVPANKEKILKNIDHEIALNEE